MLSGKRLKLSKRALALELFAGQHHPVSIPAGASLEFTSEPTHDNGLANAVWDKREGVIFLSSISRDEREDLGLETCRW